MLKDGETLAWFKLATRLKMSVERVMDETTSRQFQVWCCLLEDAPNDFDPIHHYLAQIAAEVRRGNVDPKKSKRVKISHFLLKFTSSFKEKGPEDITEDQLAERTARSKARWFGMLGMRNPDKE